jgi:hypothetical protein
MRALGLRGVCAVAEKRGITEEEEEELSWKEDQEAGMRARTGWSGAWPSSTELADAPCGLALGCAL